MRLLVYEHITGGGYAEQPLPHELARAGEAMVRALLRDLESLTHIELFALRDARFPALATKAHCVVASTSAQVEAEFERMVRLCDAIWLIAPETDRVLENLARRVTAAGRALAGPSAQAIVVTASKWKTFRRLQAANIATIPTFRCDDHLLRSNEQESESDTHLSRGNNQGFQSDEDLFVGSKQSSMPDGRWITKPEDGCASVDTRVHADAAAAHRWLSRRNDSDRFLLQPYVAGAAFSVSVCAGDSSAHPVSVNRQRVIVEGDRLSYEGVEINVQPVIDQDICTLVRHVHRAIPGLRGYFGIDLIHADGHWVVVEVNPRLTESYVGLSQAVGVNIGARALNAALGSATRLPLAALSTNTDVTGLRT